MKVSTLCMSGSRSASAAMTLCLAVMAGACATNRSISADPPLRASALLGKALFDSGTGDVAGAESALREAIAMCPGYLEAHRALQDLLEREFRGHEAFEEYRALYSGSPVTPLTLYLYGRLVPEPGMQAELFERANELAPDDFWTNVAIGYSLYQHRDFREAVHHFRKAVAAKPLSAPAWNMLADASRKNSDFDGALAAYRKAALADPEDHSHAFMASAAMRIAGRTSEAFLNLLSIRASGGIERSTIPEIRRMMEENPGECVISEEDAGPGSDSNENLAFRGWLKMTAGDFEGAASILMPFTASGYPFPETARDLRRALFATGRYADGLAAWKNADVLGLSGLPGNACRSRLLALGSAVKSASAEGAGPKEIRALGCALLDIGWVEEGVGVLARAVAAGSREAASDLAKGRGFLQAVNVIRQEINRGYAEHLSEAGSCSLTDMLERMRPALKACTGIDAGGGNEVRSFAFAGSLVVDPEGGESPLLAYFRSFNHKLVLGRRSGGPPEATLMNVVYSSPGPVKHLGVEVACQMIAGEHFRVRSFGEYLGGGLFGLALAGFFYVNLDEVAEDALSLSAAVRRARSNTERLARFGSWKIRNPDEALWLDAGNGLSQLLLRSAFEGVADKDLRNAATRTLYDGVVNHELMHVRDADRYLPVSSNPIAALGLAIRKGFSAAAIESHMEERAALASLAASERPGVELAFMLRHAPYSESQIPHSRGYCRLLDRFVSEVLSDETRPQDIEPDRNVCRQLWKASPGYIRRISRRIATGDGIDKRD